MDADSIDASSTEPAKASKTVAPEGAPSEQLKGQHERIVVQNRKNRFNLVSDEIDHLVLSADERGRSVDNKASFLAVAAGVIFGGQVQVSIVLPWFVASAPLALAALSLACAGFALLPSKRLGTTPKLLWLTYRDSELSGAQVAERMTFAKVQYEERREISLGRRAKVIFYGFMFLFLSMIAFVSIYAVNLALF